MFEITCFQLLLLVTLIWIVIRAIIAVRSRTFSFKRELLMLLVYICIVVIFRFVYFGFHLVDGKIPPLKIGFEKEIGDMISIRPFYFVVDRYDGWKMNIIGNITMFIPVGIVWPICFKRLDTLFKTILACFGFTLFIEVTQLFCIGRHTDLDDLILNTCGAAIGACIVFVIRWILAKRRPEE